MKKIILASAITASALMADVKTITPYVGTINYNSSSAKSIKDKAKLAGIYTSIGNLGYLLEFSYGYTNINYKNSTIADLKQHDITLKYGKFYKNYAWNAGLHYIKNSETGAIRDLSGGYTAIFGLEGYEWFGYNKLSYGIDTYYSYYNHAFSDITRASETKVGLLQFSPKVMYSKVVNINTKNTILITVNFIKANDYKNSSYTSYEISDTLGYKKFYASLKYNGGKMRSGVRDGGFTVYNTKDLLKSAYTAKLGYYFTPKFEADISYTHNNYQEYNAVNLSLLPEGSNSIAVFSMSYSY